MKGGIEVNFGTVKVPHSCCDNVILVCWIVNQLSSYSWFKVENVLWMSFRNAWNCPIFQVSEKIASSKISFDPSLYEIVNAWFFVLSIRMHYATLAFYCLCYNLLKGYLWKKHFIIFSASVSDFSLYMYTIEVFVVVHGQLMQHNQFIIGD